MTRKTWIILGVVIGLFLLVAAGVAFWLQRGGGAIPEPVSNIINQLPGASERDEPLEQIPPTARAPGTTAVPTGVAQSSPGGGANLGVTIAYRHIPQFALSIESAERTGSRTTTEFYEPTADAPFSIVRVLGANGAVLGEARFSVPSFVIYESFDSGVGRQQLGPAGEGTIYVVLPLPAGAQAAQVELVSPNGQVFDEAVVVSEDQSRAPFLQELLAPDALAQAPGGGDGVFTIVVTHDRGAGAAFQNVVRPSVEEMVRNLEPWRTYRSHILVEPVYNSFDGSLGCDAIELPGGSFPRCFQEGRVIAEVARHVPNWDVIIVAVNFPCNCGSVGGGATAYSRVVAVGSNASPTLVGHELGHAVGQMVDEYLGDLGVTSFRLGPNCFSSTQACQRAIEPYQADDSSAQCSAGCSTVSNFRPSSQLMYKNSPTYGPLETCLLEQRLVAELGVAGQGFAETQFCRSSEEPPPGDFWGWFKGG